MAGLRTLNSKRNIIWGLTNKFVILLVPFFIRTVFIKNLGAEYLGLSSLFVSILQVLSLAELGFSSAVVFCMYKPIAEEDTDTICALMALFRKVYKIIGIIILVVGLVISPFLPKLINGTYPQDINIYYLYYIYLANTAVSYLLFAYKSALLVAHQRNDIEMKITTLFYLIQYALQYLSIIILKDFYYYSLAFLVITIVSNIARAYITDKLYPQYKCRGVLKKEQIDDVKKRVFGAFIQRICATTRNSLDSIFISAFLGLTTVTIYSNYFYIMSSIHGILYVIVTGITASVGDSIARESKEKNHYDMKKFSFMYAWISGWCTVCLLCLYQPFMKVWVGEELMFPLSVVILFCIYFYSHTIGDVRTAYTTGAGLWWEGRYRSIAETVLNVILNWVLGALFGVYGIILATIISLVLVNFLWSTIILFKYYFKEISAISFYKEHCYYFFITVLVAGICYFICSLVNTTDFLNLVIRVIIVTFAGNGLFFLIYRKNAYFCESIGLIKAILIKKRGA